FLLKQAAAFPADLGNRNKVQVGTAIVKYDIVITAGIGWRKGDVHMTERDMQRGLRRSFLSRWPLLSCRHTVAYTGTALIMRGQPTGSGKLVVCENNRIPVHF